MSNSGCKPRLYMDLKQAMILGDRLLTLKEDVFLQIAPATASFVKC